MPKHQDYFGRFIRYFVTSNSILLGVAKNQKQKTVLEKAFMFLLFFNNKIYN